MDKNKKIIIAIIGIVILGLIVFLILSKLSDSNNSDLEKVKYDNFELSGEVEFSLCKDGVSCTEEDKIIKDEIGYKGDIQEVKDIVENINYETREYHNKIKSSKVNNSCSPVKQKKYKYMYSNVIYPIFYEDDNYIGISYIRNEIDLCTSKISELREVSYIYSKKQNKLITGEELINDLGITNEMVKDIIDEVIDSTKELKKEGYSYDNVTDGFVYHISIDGKIGASFYDKNKRQNIAIAIGKI